MTTKARTTVDKSKRPPGEGKASEPTIIAEQHRKADNEKKSIHKNISSSPTVEENKKTIKE